jgi:hypothetical protein
MGIIGWNGHDGKGNESSDNNVAGVDRGNRTANSFSSMELKLLSCWRIFTEQKQCTMNHPSIIETKEVNTKSFVIGPLFIRL